MLKCLGAEVSRDRSVRKADVSVGLLLGPGWDHRITKKDDDKLKFALFDFVANTARNF